MAIATHLELVRDFHSYYHEKVKPAFLGDTFGQARMYLSNLVLQLQFASNELYPYRSAGNCINTAEVMLEDIRRGRIPTSDQFQEFEGFLAQLKLAVSSGNRA